MSAVHSSTYSRYAPTSLKPKCKKVKLPGEKRFAWLQVAKRLTLPDLAALARCSQALYEIAGSDKIWRHHYIATWKKSPPSSQEEHDEQCAFFLREEEPSIAKKYSLLKKWEKSEIWDIEAFQKAGGDLNLRDEEGKTLLYRTLEKGLSEDALLLIQAGADVKIPDLKGQTPLHVATKKIVGSIRSFYFPPFRKRKLDDKYKNLFNALQSAGASAEISDNNGLTPRKIAKKHKSVLSLLRVSKEEIDAADAAQEKNSRTKTVKDLFRQNLLYLREQQPLVISHLKLYESLTRSLMPWDLKAFKEKGGDLNTRDADGKTLLYHCIDRRETEQAAALIKVGADGAIPDVEGFSPLFLAALGGNAKILRLLNPDSENANGSFLIAFSIDKKCVASDQDSD